MFQLRSRLIRVGALLVAAGFFEGLPVSAQEAYGEKELTFPLEIEGDHSVSVHLFSVLVPGTLRAEVTWEVSRGAMDATRPSSAILEASLTGGRRPSSTLSGPGEFSTGGSSPLVLTYEVT